MRSTEVKARWWCLAAFLLGTVAAYAERVVILHGGKAYLVDLGPANEIPLATVTTKTGGKPDDPNPPKPSGVASQVAKWTKAANPSSETVKALVLATRAVRQQVESGKTKPLDVWGGRKLFSNSYAVILGAQGEGDKWKSWLKNHTQEVIRQTQDKANGLRRKAEVAKLLADTEAGLQAYLDSSGLLDRIDLKKVIRIVSLLLKMDGFDIKTILDILDILSGEARLR